MKDWSKLLSAWILALSISACNWDKNEEISIIQSQTNNWVNTIINNSNNDCNWITISQSGSNQRSINITRNGWCNINISEVSGQMTITHSNNSISISNNIQKDYNYEGNLNENINTVSRDVFVWKNISEHNTIETISWNVDIIWKTEWNIETISGSIKIGWNNMWDIQTVSWDCDITWNNYWSIQSISWAITLEKNLGIISTSNWVIRIWDLKIEKISWKWNNNISIYGWSSISVNWWNISINWESININSENGIYNLSEENSIKIWKLLVEKKDWKFKLKYKWNYVSNSELKEKGYIISDDFYTISYLWQSISWKEQLTINGGH